MPTVLLGNSQAIDPGPGTPLGERVTIHHHPAHLPLEVCVRNLSHGDGAWNRHSAAPAPSWVESDDPALAELLSAHWGCPIGRPAPAVVEGTVVPPGPVAAAPVAPVAPAPVAPAPVAPAPVVPAPAVIPGAVVQTPQEG